MLDIFLKVKPPSCWMIDVGSEHNVPIVEKKRRKATPSTMCGIISGDSRNAEIASRPVKRCRAIASAAGIASGRRLGYSV